MKWKNILTWFLVFLSTLQPLWAANKPLILPHPSVSEKEFLRELFEVEGGQRNSDLQWDELPNPTRRQNLFEIFEIAQRQFLEGQLEESKKSFLELTELAYEDDWKSGEQKFIIFSYLRLAQMEQDPIQRRNFVIEAAKWNTEERIDRSLFPPPLIANLQEMRKQIRKAAQLWRPSIHYPVRFIVLNGIKYNYRPGRRYKVFTGTTRVTLLSDHFEKITRTVNTSSLYVTEFKSSQVLVDGSCESPSVSETLLPAHDETIVVFPQNCTKYRDADYWVLKKDKPLHRSLKPAIPLFAVQQEMTEPSEPIWKKTWFWIGVGVVVAGVVASIQAQNNQSKSGGSSGETKPTQRTSAP